MENLATMNVELDADRANRIRARRVIILLAALFVLGLSDLYHTLTHMTSLGMEELNPVGKYLQSHGSFTGLTLFKLGTMGITTGLLLKLRHYRVSEAAAWLLVAVMVMLSFHWQRYNDDMSNQLTNASYNSVAHIQLSSVEHSHGAPVP